MAKWVTAKEMTSGGTLDGGIEYDDTDSFWKIYQDEKPFLEQAKIDRELGAKRDIGYKKFATIPDIVAIEIKEKYGVDIHCPHDSTNPATLTKFKKIIKQEYPHLLSY